MIHLERTSFVSEGGDSGQYRYQVQVIDSRDKLSQLIALEQQLELTEQRFKKLQNYVEYIRSLYHGSVQDQSSIQVCNMTASRSYFPADLSNLSPETTFMTSSDQLDNNRSFHSEETNDTDAGGDSSRIKDPGKEETVKKKKAVKRKLVARKVKTAAAAAGRKPVSDESSSRMLEKKMKLKTQKSLASLKNARRDLNEPSTLLRATVSSQLKRTSPNRIFNFRSIPFVAGKATTRSHNLGVKIQETLSIIKRNTPAEVGRCADAGVGTGRPCTNPVSRGSKRSRSRSSVTTMKPIAAKSSMSLSDSYLFMDDLDDSADVNSYLKKALIYIQSDFTETLNEYKAISKEKDAADENKLKALEEKLDKKEEVIIAFSKLYNQVISLRRQLEDRFYSSDLNDGSRAMTRTCSMINNYPAVKLTRLLRKIQDFQNKIQGYQDV